MLDGAVPRPFHAGPYKYIDSIRIGGLEAVSQGLANLLQVLGQKARLDVTPLQHPPAHPPYSSKP